MKSGAVLPIKLNTQDEYEFDLWVPALIKAIKEKEETEKGRVDQVYDSRGKVEVQAEARTMDFVRRGD